MKVFDVTASPTADWWAITIDLPGRTLWTQSRTLGQVESTARDALALALDVAPKSIEVHVHAALSDQVDQSVALANECAILAEEAKEVAQLSRQDAVRILRREGFSVRDIGKLLDLSPQRISQLLAASPGSAAKRGERIRGLVTSLQDRLDHLSNSASGARRRKSA